ncbi:MAG TPA: toxin TcdB middle/C-terminal domain-containing protein, partial [Bacteroidia bacterium]|nr:toxin TcdB middle/C-terminal domain-containing protein [Bacteroidia bacterium]
SRYSYSTSTKFYQQAEKNGTPWITRLPFPVHVVEKTEAIDLVDNVRFITQYAYHHGYYDGEEREFRGFGMVEQWDSESYDEHLKLNENSVEEELFVSPVYTKSWFHTGFFLDKEKILGQYANEYYQGDQQTWSLSQPVIPMNFEASEVREAVRAFKGSVLRQEIYTKDGTEKEKHPYTVVTTNYEVRRLQPKEKNKYSVFHLIPFETLTYHYERNADDPRIGHQLNLERDEFGHVTQSIAISYPRRKPEFDEQSSLLAILKNEKVVNVIDQQDWYRLGVPYQSEEWEVSGFSFSGKLLDVTTIKTLLAKAITIFYENKPTSGVATKREVSEQCVYFYNETLNDRLPFGELSFHALPYDTYHKSLTPSLIEKIYGSRLNESLLKETGYVFDEGSWWLPSGKVIFDAVNFYQPTESIDP